MPITKWARRQLLYHSQSWNYIINSSYNKCFIEQQLTVVRAKAWRQKGSYGTYWFHNFFVQILNPKWGKQFYFWYLYPTLMIIWWLCERKQYEWMILRKLFSLRTRWGRARRKNLKISLATMKSIKLREGRIGGYILIM